MRLMHYINTEFNTQKISHNLISHFDDIVLGQNKQTKLYTARRME